MAFTVFSHVRSRGIGSCAREAREWAVILLRNVGGRQKSSGAGASGGH